MPGSTVGADLYEQEQHNSTEASGRATIIQYSRRRGAGGTECCVVCMRLLLIGNEQHTAKQVDISSSLGAWAPHHPM
jgi:hypothetical protein